jgi:ABC-type phosphate/phosphonate transport system substrate-binding protein
MRLLTAAVATLAFATTAPAADKAPLTMVVMDPLAAPLSCPCVAGYAQRDYEKLAKYLEGQLGRPVKVAFDESLTGALKKKTDGKADIVIGKCSVVLADAKASHHGVTQVASLSGKDGSTTMTGLVVVPSADPAKSVADLKGYRVIFGVAECDEKHAAALALMRKHGVSPPEKLETCSACSDGATAILELGPNVRAATVISSYAAPLLEGCGTIKKGDLRVIGTTEPVPFVTAFAADSLPAADREALAQALLKMTEHPALMVALETKRGFIAAPSDGAKKK